MHLNKHIEKINQTESHILGIIEMDSRTVAEVAKEMNISRQAAHKCAQGMISRGYITSENREGSNKEKLLVLTEKGRQCNAEMLKIKVDIEKQVSEELGEPSVEIMKLLLRKKWI